MAIIFDGNAAAHKIREEVSTRRQKIDKPLILSILYSGENPGQKTFSEFKRKVGDTLDIETDIITVPKNFDTKDYVDLIEKISKDSDAVLVQLPLPDGIDTRTVLDAIPYEKDVEGITSQRMTEVMENKAIIYSPVARAAKHAIDEAIQMLKLIPQELDVAIIGYNDLCGKPLSAMLSDQFRSITICRSSTKDLKASIKNADIIVSSTGNIHLIDKDMVKKNIIAVDVGYEEDSDGTIAGDLHPNIQEKAAFLTPVPGGIGPLTVAYIFDNVLKLISEGR